MKLQYLHVLVHAAERTECICSTHKQAIVCSSCDYPDVVLTLVLVTSRHSYCLMTKRPHKYLMLTHNHHLTVYTLLYYYIVPSVL